MALSAIDQAGIAPPPAARRALAAMATADARQMLTLVAEAGTIQRLLAGAGVTMRVLKGPPLAMAVYGDLAVRQCRDLDLLVDPEALPLAYRTLLAAGYRPDEPAASLTGDALRLWTWLRRDIALRSPHGGALIELHDRLSNDPRTSPRGIAAADVAPIGLGSSIVVEALTGDALVLYLCVHGAYHGWTRLKWLADVAVLLEAYAAAGLERLHARARYERVDLELGQALLLCRHLFGTTLPPALQTTLERSYRLKLLTRCALAFLADPEELHARRFGTTRASLYCYLLSRGVRQTAYRVLHDSCDFRVAIALGGSRGALALSIAARPFIWIWRKAIGSDIRRAAPAVRC